MNLLEARRRILGRNVYKRTTEGNPAIAQGSLARMYPGITMQGWTEQAQYAGKNLFNIDDFASKNKATIRNGRILFNQSLGVVTYNLNLDSGAYSISIARDGYSGINIKINEVAVIDNGSGNNYTGNFDVSDGDSVVLEFAEGQNPNGEDRIIYDIMLNSGSTALPYEPYTGGQPSPSPEYPQPITNAGKYDEATGKYQYEVKLTGANLFDISKVITREGFLTNNGDGTLTATPKTGNSGVTGLAPNTLRDFCPDLISGKMYRLTANTTRYPKSIFLTKVAMAWYFGSFRVVTDADLESEVFFYASGVNTEAVISDIMITEVENADYEPYRPPQTVTLTSDRPLTKWDKLEKRNGQWGWVYKSNEIVLDGSEQFNTAYLPFVLFPEVEKGVDTAPPSGYPFHDIYSNYSYTLRWSNSSFLTIAFDLDTHAFDSVDAFKKWLRQKYSEGKPFKYCYETEAETFIPLTESEQEAMNALHSYRPTTVLTNQQGCQMALTYKTRKGAGGGNLLDYRKLINPEKWIPFRRGYRHFDISLKPNTTYKLSVSVNNMHNGYKKDYIGKFALYLGETPGSVSDNTMFGNTNADSVVTECTFTTSENPFYINLYVLTWNSEYLHIVFDELLPNIELEEVAT